MRDDSPCDGEGFRLKNIQIRQTVSRKIKIKLERVRGGGDPAFWEEPASWEGTCILGGNYFFKIDYLAIKSDIYLFKTNSCCDKYLVLLKDYNHSVITCCVKE